MKRIYVKEEAIISRIYLIRGDNVMIDKDLAELYEVETKRLNEQVKRNIERFPKDFMFQLSRNEFEILRSQNATASWGGRRSLPYAFTEHGVLMLSSVLNSDRAINVNIKIMRIYNNFRKMLFMHKDLLSKYKDFEGKLTEHDNKIEIIFEYLKQFEKAKQEELEFKKRPRVGYKIPK